MIRKLMIVTAVAGAVAALSAPAIAQAVEFKSSGEPANILGEQDSTGKVAHQVFVAGGVKVTCKKVALNGTQKTKAATSLTLTATYSECEMINGATTVLATVKMNNCDYLLHSNGEVDITSITGFTCNTMPISMEGKNSEGKFCHIEIGSQSGLKKASFSTITNAGGKKEITGEFNLTGIKYEATGSFCNETGVKTNGSEETGNVVLGAFEDKVNGAQFDYSFE